MPAKVFDEIAPKYVDRKGGYTRIIKIGQRKGDGAMEVVLELVNRYTYNFLKNKSLSTECKKFR